MNFAPISRALAPYRPSLRPIGLNPVEQGYGNQPPRISTDVASLSNETRHSLAEKAQALPPPPPAETRRKPPARRESAVATQDFAGRTCSGTLHGPLLMEDPGLPACQELDSGRFASVDFVCDDPLDFQPMRLAGLALADLDAEQLRAPYQESPLNLLESGDVQMAYHGVRHGLGHFVHSSEGLQTEHRQVRLPNGQIAFFSPGPRPGELSILVPAGSLEDLAEWGRGLLAIA